VLLIHGAGGNHLIWPALLRRIPHATAYLPDLPGHGRSGREGRSAIEGYADVMREFLTALSVPQAAFVGHSMGGAIALWLAVHHPGICQRLVLLNTAARFTVPAPILAALREDPRGAVDLICQQVLAPHALPALADLTRQTLLDLPPKVLQDDFLACQAFDLVDRLPDIRVPTLAIGGDADLMTPPDNSRLLAELIPAARLIMLKDAGHAAPATHPQTVRDAMVSFLSS